MKRRKAYKRKKQKIELMVLAIIAVVVLYKLGFVQLQHIFTVLVVILGMVAVYLLLLLLRKKVRKYRYLHSDIYKIDKMDGVEFEQYLKANLEKLGYHVKTTPATADYGVDLICKKGDECIAVQAKRYKDKIGVSAVQQVIGGMHYYNCTQGMVVTNSYFTNNACELAAKSNVVLWDRNTITKKFRISSCINK